MIPAALAIISAAFALVALEVTFIAGGYAAANHDRGSKICLAIAVAFIIAAAGAASASGGAYVAGV